MSNPEALHRRDARRRRLLRLARHDFRVTAQPAGMGKARARLDRRYRERVCQTVTRAYFTVKLSRDARPDAEAIIRREFDQAFGGEPDIALFAVARGDEPQRPDRAVFLSHARQVLEEQGLDVLA